MGVSFVNTTWSYNGVDDDEQTFGKLTNSTGYNIYIDSITVKVGTGSGTVKAYKGQECTGNGQAFNVYVTINGVKSSAGNVSKVTYKETYTAEDGNKYTYFKYKGTNTESLTIYFSNKPYVANGATATAYVKGQCSPTHALVFDKSTTCTIGYHNANVPVTGISLSKDDVWLTTGTSSKVNKSETITATITPSDATDKSVTWSSNNTNSATVSGGTITAVGAGTECIITAKANGGTNITDTCKAHIYSNPSVSNVKTYVGSTQVSTVNGDTTNFTVSYTTPTGAFTYDTFTNACSVWNTNDPEVLLYNMSGSNIDVVSHTADLLPYDNTNIKVWVKNTHYYTEIYAWGSATIKVLYRPIAKPINVSSPIGEARSTSTYTISWAKPDGYNGIYSKYTVTMTDETSGQSQVIALGDTTGTSITFKPGDYEFIPRHTYKLTIQPKYVYNGTEYFNTSAAYTASGFMEYICIPQAPVDIISPTGKGLWYGGKYKVLVQMPFDDNYEYLPEPRKTNYRYEDLIITINRESFSVTNNPDKFSLMQSDLTHQCCVIMDYDGTPLLGTTTLTATAKFGDGIGAWSTLATITYTTEDSYPIMEFVQDEYILSSNFIKLSKYINNMVAFVIPEEDELYTQLSIDSKVGTYIYASNYVTLLQALHKIYEFIARYGTVAQEITITSEYITSYENTMDEMNDTIGSGESSIEDPDSNTQSVVYQLNQIAEQIGLGNPLSLLTNYYEVTVVNADDWVGVIIYALGLAAYVYEMILRVLGITEDNLLRLMYAIENKCDITYIGSDSTLYTISAYGIVNNIIKLLGVGSYYNPDGTTQAELVTLLKTIESTTGISYDPEPTTTFDNTLEGDIEGSIASIEATTRG